MVLQRLEGLSDREAVDRFTFDLRWKYAAGGLGYDHPGFVHTVLVDMRARLRRSARPDRILEAGLEVAREAGLIGRKRVLDSTPLYDAVATQDTVTLIRSAIRALLRTVDAQLGAELRACCRRDDDDAAPGKPACDWDDAAAREALVDALAHDANAILAALDGRTLNPEIRAAAQLVATVVGQDLERRDDGKFHIARRVAPGRVISIVDPEARHGHKTAARGFDGYKGHVAIDPDSELITATAVTPGNAADGSAAETLLADVLPAAAADAAAVAATPDAPSAATSAMASPVEVFGDASYGTAEIIDKLEAAGVVAHVTVLAPSALTGRFGKDAFESISRPRPCGVPRACSSRSASTPPTVAGSRCLRRRVLLARSAANAPMRAPGEPSGSTAGKRCCSAIVRSSARRRGRTTIAPRDRRSSARSPI
jgi:hypothetical protein